jgi:hypothetical protein
MPPRIPPTALFSLLLVLLIARPAWALRFGALGNSPLDAQPGWPEGAAAVFNPQGRIAYWELNGQWKSECRGDAEAFSKVVANFALIKAEGKKLILHDGVGKSYWVQAVQKDGDAKVDWIFTVWQADLWRQWQGIGRPAGTEPPKPPPPQIDVYCGGNLNVDDVDIPEGIVVVDQRLESRGFQLTDIHVLEGKVHDMATGKPLAARMQLRRYDRNPDGSGTYVTVASVDADDTGRWVLKHAPQGNYSITLSAPGYAPRYAGYVELDDQPSWSGFNADLSPAVTLTGTVTDESGHPLAGASVRLGSAYGQITTDVLTDKSGRFECDELPQGELTLSAFKDGYVHPGLGDAVRAPAADVKLTMFRAGGVDVVVDFGGKAKPEEYLVHIEPEGGLKIGSWGGAGRADSSGFAKFTNVPPGKYVLWGRPNPGADSDETPKVPVEVKGGETREVTLKAK